MLLITACCSDWCAIQQAKRRYQETVQEKNGIQADINELTQKYQQKSL
jgi:hypothetical protein